MGIRKRREMRAEAIASDIAEARKAREEIQAERDVLTRAVASFRGNRGDKFGSDLEDTFTRKPRHA